MKGIRTDSYKVRIVRLGLTQGKIAKEISGNGRNIYPADLSRVINGIAVNSPANNDIRNRLESYLIAKEKEQGWI